MRNEHPKYDVLIVGGGPIGLACGIEAQKRCLSHIIVEKGCLVNSIFHYPTNMTFFSTSDRLEIGEVPFISHGDKPTRREALEYYRRVTGSWKLNIRTYERVIDVKGEVGNFEVVSEKGGYFSKAVIVATGYYDRPNLLNIPGEELSKVRHYYDEPHPYAYRKVAVVGASNSAVDVALELYRVGAEVTLIVRESKLWEGIKYWVKPDIENRIKEGSIKAYFDSNVTRISESEIEVKTTDGTVTLENDYVMAMTGYHADFDFLSRIGIHLADDGYFTPACDLETFESNRSGIFLAGVVCGGMETSKLFIENSREHAVKIFDYIDIILK
ncbi:MAG: YpdA family putative bacillithiol disulfide reductase [Gemmatimonadota bacterium]|nr:MAG: YpdA family putative bacillithiol disulfide reductase [Gemmatimonadota bacterium]